MLGWISQMFSCQVTSAIDFDADLHAAYLEKVNIRIDLG